MVKKALVLQMTPNFELLNGYPHFKGGLNVKIGILNFSRTPVN